MIHRVKSTGARPPSVRDSPDSGIIMEQAQDGPELAKGFDYV